ncbi:hypothetical protein FLA_1996 [Filimonas lacunae]|nr:hypothetical protein FLA_1996 [Filimonas lacunae]
MNQVGEGMFQEVSGLNATLGTEELKEGGVNLYTTRLPGRAKYDNLVLKRGLLVGSPLTTWVFDALQNFLIDPQPVQVRLIDEQKKPIVTWSIKNAYPVAIKTDPFRAMDNALAIESLELAYTYFTRTNI